jgi:tetratricopeptide (TPR) repeat protein
VLTGVCYVVRVKNATRWWLLVAVAAWLGVSMAQTLPSPLSANAARLLREAGAALAAAHASDVPRTPDHPGWREALVLGRQALRDSDHPDVRRFLARAYALVGWSVRSMEHFDALLASGASLVDPPRVAVAEVASAELYARMAADLGFTRYELGDIDGAIAIYERWLAALPGDVEATRWLARLHLERLDPDAALPFWETLAREFPDDASIAFYLGEARRGATVGAMAAVAFREGVNAYEAGARDVALERFEAALAASPAFAEAAVWAGRMALELSLPALSAQYWARAVELRPDDAGAAYFLRLARDQASFGIPAGTAFHDGLTAYERRRPEEAVTHFERAVAANGDFTAAWVWLARVRQELGRYDAAVVAWERVTQLDPRDDRAQFFLNVARQQRGFAVEAGRAFAEGLAAYEAADFATAESRLRDAVRLDPTAAQAWVWLGRVRFGLQRFEEAADAFGRAAQLLPDDTGVAFFAREAARLAAEAAARQAEGDDAIPDAPEGGAP